MNAEKRHMDRVAAMPCVICGDAPVELHHIRDGHGMAQRASNWLVVPLCPVCHRGTGGIHGNRSVMRARKLTEIDLLAETIKRLSP